MVYKSLCMHGNKETHVIWYNDRVERVYLCMNVCTNKNEIVEMDESRRENSLKRVAPTIFLKDFPHFSPLKAHIRHIHKNLESDPHKFLWHWGKVKVGKGFYCVVYFISRRENYLYLWDCRKFT